MEGTFIYYIKANNLLELYIFTQEQDMEQIQFSFPISLIKSQDGYPIFNKDNFHFL